MIISRRQRESLLDEVSRMLANKQNVAFANHAKIADRISNGDLALYMDSAKKEFVMKYGNNNIRFNPKEKSITDLSSIVFSDKSTLQGITSTPLSNEKIAISAKWAYNHYQDTLKRMKKWNPEGLNILQGEATITGITDEGKYVEQHLLTYEYWKDHEQQKEEEDEKNYDERYAFKEHTHDQYADKQHIHDQYALKEHAHSEYSSVWHQHDERYALKDHTHSQYRTEKQIIDLIKEKTKTPWYEKLFKGIEVINEVAQDGYIYWLQTQIEAIYATLAANGIVDTGQTASITGVGAVATGVASKLLKVADGLSYIGEKFKSVSGIVEKITTPIRNVANHLQGYQQIFDVIDDVRDLTGWTNQTAHHIGDVTTNLLPDVTETITKGTTTAQQILNNGYSAFRDLPSSTVAM